MHGTFKVYNYPIPKADPRFPVRTENTRGTRRQRIRRAKREAAVFSDVRTVRKNVSPADSARRAEMPEGRSRTAGHTQPKGRRNLAAGRNDDNNGPMHGRPNPAGKTRNQTDRNENRPVHAGHTKVGAFLFRMRRITECPILFVFGPESERARGRKHRTGCASIERLGFEARFGHGSNDSLRGLVGIDRQ